VHPGTVADNLLKCAVKSDPESPGIYNPTQAFGDMQLGREKERTGTQAPPKNGGILAVPGKNSLGICGQEALFAQIPAHREQTVRFCHFRGWKNRIGSKVKNRHCLKYTANDYFSRTWK
jgi:hypothetical protein